MGHIPKHFQILRFLDLVLVLNVLNMCSENIVMKMHAVRTSGGKTLIKLNKTKLMVTYCQGYIVRYQRHIYMHS